MSQSVSAWIKTSSFAEERVIIISMLPIPAALSPGRKFRESQSSLVAAREPVTALEESAAAATGTKQQFHQAGFSFSSGNWIYAVFTKFLVLFPEKPKRSLFWLTDLTSLVFLQMKAHSCQTQAQLERLGFEWRPDPDHLLWSLKDWGLAWWCLLSNLSEDPEDMCVFWGFLSGERSFGFKSGSDGSKGYFTFWESCSLLISFSLASSISLFSLLLPVYQFSELGTFPLGTVQFPTLAFLLFPTKMSFLLWHFSKFFLFPIL